MKSKLLFFFFSFCHLCFLSNVFGQTNYPGNAKSGFGGPIGTGSLDISSAGGNITFTLNKASASAFNDVLVVYLDTKSGGFITTDNFVDGSSPLMIAISGFDGATNRATFNFSGAFTPDYALALTPNSGTG
ncbi:MAG TPA: hypothetical protein VF610_11145, partial [Segetibacter sp.]